MIQRFFPLLGDALSVGLESTLPAHRKDATVPQGFFFRFPASTHTAIGLTHPATASDIDLMERILFPVAKYEAIRLIVFSAMPENLAPHLLFQRLNFRQTPNGQFLGLACGRHGETKAFPIRHRDQSPDDPAGYVNLDFLSKAKTWNPLYVRYRLATPLQDVEYGCVRIDAGLTAKRHPFVAIVRVPEAAAPEFLKTAETFPK